MSKAFIFGVGGNNENGNSVNRSLKKILDYKQSTAYLFYCYKETSDFREVIKYSDTENVTDMKFMFNTCSKLTSVPLFDTSKVTNMFSMFGSCSNLTTVPLFDTSNVTEMQGMFGSCSKLTTVPLFDTSKVTSMPHMFSYCSNLTTVPKFNISNARSMYCVFYNCTNLTTVPEIDVRNVTDMDSTFYNCKALKTCLLKNIKTSLQVGSGSTYGHLLTMPSLLNLLNETVYSSISKTLTLGSTNLAKFTGEYEYVKKTGKLLDLDDNETNVIVSGQTKIPVTWCSSTDEGAMKVADYMSSKGWALA